MYSSKVKSLLMSPLNGVEGDFYNGVGTASRETKCPGRPAKLSVNTVIFKVLIEETGSISAARWSVFGDPVAVAAASWCVSEIVGKTVAELCNLITPERAALYLDVLDEADIKGGCSVVVDALINAINDYSKRKGPPVIEELPGEVSS